MTPAQMAEAVVEFSDGLPGFEDQRQFVLVSSAVLDPFTLVQGIGAAAPAFAAIDPRCVVTGYAAELQSPDRARLHADESTPLVWLALVSVQTSGALTANLRAPLVINPLSLRGIQLIRDDSQYAFDHPLQAA